VRIDIVSLIRDPVIGWYIEDINGIKNRKPGPALIEKIKLAFSDAGIQAEQFEELEQLWEDDTSFL